MIIENGIIQWEEGELPHEIDVYLNGGQSLETVELKQYDEGYVYIVGNVWNNGSRYMIPHNAKIDFKCTKKSGLGVLNSCQFVGNQIIYKVTYQTTVEHGYIDAEFNIYETDNVDGVTKVKNTSSCNFKMNIAKSALDNNTILSANEFNSILNTISNANQAVDRIEDTIISMEQTQSNWETQIANKYANLETEYATELTGVKSDLASITTELDDVLDTDKVSKYIDIVGDITTNLATTLADLESRDIKYAYFDKKTEIDLNSALEQKNVLMIGKSEIRKSNKNNSYYNISDSMRSFDDDVNKNYCKFSQLKTAISENRPINFTILGDSISTNGDLLNVNTSEALGTIEQSPDGITLGDTYTSYLYDQIGDAIKDKTINFRNRAIGGTYLGDWNSWRTINTVEKTWIEHIKDTTPDVLIIAFGMNHNTFDKARRVAWDLKQITEYVNANFVIKPDLVFVTSPRPTYQPQSWWGDFEEHTSREITASAIRYGAIQYKAYLLDVNRISNIKRTGTDWLNPTFKEIDESPFILNQKINGSYEFIGSKAMKINKQLKDFVLKFSLIFPENLTSSDYVNITFNNTSDEGLNSNQIVINPVYATGSGIRSYCKIANHSNWGTDATRLKFFETQKNVFHLRIEKRGNKLEVWEETFNGISLGLVLRDDVSIWDCLGDINFSIFQSNETAKVTMSDFRLFEPIYEEYMPEITEKMMWGEFNPNDTGLKTPYGGNGVNHPSSIGIKKVYFPLVEKLAQDIADVYRNS